MVDLSRFGSVKTFADKFDSDEGRLDLLILNAATAPMSYEATPDGFEAA